MLLINPLVLLVIFSMYPPSESYPSDMINKNQELWKAGSNFDGLKPKSYLKGLTGTVISNMDGKNTKYQNHLVNGFTCASSLLDFDARQKWQHCGSLNEIRDQGACGSCWAVGIASVMTDRICTLTNGTEEAYISEQDILSCCTRCVVNRNSICDGGFVNEGWAFATNVGVVTGGLYSTEGGCKSYEFQSCDHKYEHKKRRTRSNTCTEIKGKKQVCDQKCNQNPNISYVHDKRKFSRIYFVHPENAMCEIYRFGPILAVMNVYEDFFTYNEGIYHRTNDKPNALVGNHTVKILGWGEDNKTKTKYWLAANSWNSHWGHKGFFKILRGENECNIESYMTAGKV